MAMKFLSLQDEDTCKKSFAELFDLEDWKIKKTVIISAYTDIKSIKEIIKHVTRQADQTSSSLQIFMDKAASRVSSDKELKGELQKLDKKIKKYFSEGSGIFFVSYGKLFHSKCYIFEGRKEGKFFIGSMNLTVSGRKNNEEILIGANYNCKTKEANAHLAKELFNYADELRDRSYTLDTIGGAQTTNTFRDLILDGFLYTESKEVSSFFSIQLSKLPDDFTYIETDIEFFNAEYTKSISIEKIIREKFKVDKQDSTKKAHWKQFCIETCYGYWSPSVYYKKIQNELDKKKTSKQYYVSIKDYLNAHENSIKKTFFETVDKIKNKIVEANLSWDFDAEAKWEGWYARVSKKMENEKFIEKLATNVQWVPCLDVWIEPSAATNFIESFFEFTCYTQQKDNAQNTLIKSLMKNLNNQDNLDSCDLVKSIEKWMAENPGCNIFLNKKDVKK